MLGGVDLGVVQAQLLVGLALEDGVGQASEPALPVLGVHIRLVVCRLGRLDGRFVVARVGCLDARLVLGKRAVGVDVQRRALAGPEPFPVVALVCVAGVVGVVFVVDRPGRRRVARWFERGPAP